jgi:hypothetical protein
MAGENRIKFQLFSESQKDFADKFAAYATAQVGSLLHRQRVYRVAFNADKKYPIIVHVLQEFPTADEYLKSLINQDSD